MTEQTGQQQNPQTDPWQRIANSLERIEKILTLMVPEAGRAELEKAKLRRNVIGGYVRGMNGGGELVNLFATHEKVDFRVGVVYEERFEDLEPFMNPRLGKQLPDGAPSPKRDRAIKQGLYQTVQPFVAYFEPTDKVTDTGYVIFRFHHAEPLNGNGQERPQPAAGRDSRQPEPPRDEQAGTDGRLALMQEFGLSEGRFSELMVQMQLPYNAANHDAIRAKLILMRDYRKLQQDTGRSHQELTALRQQHKLGPYGPEVDARLRALIKGTN